MATSERNVNHAVEEVETTARDVKRVAGAALEGLTDAVADVQARVAPEIARVTDEAKAIARRGVRMVRERSDAVRDGAVRLSDSTAAYTRKEPIKALLVAAAAGAALLSLAAMLARIGGKRD